MDIPKHKIEYTKPTDGPESPYELFKEWLADAEKTDEPYPTAMNVATIDPDGMPSVRVVLMRHYDENGFIFYTNTLSRKGKAIAANPVAGINFYWKALERQIRIEGTVTQVSDEQADAYYAQRPRGSRIGAWASLQSEPIAERSVLEQRVKELEAQYEGQDEIPRPPHWSGYCIKPIQFEFWQEGLYRLHSRLVYKNTGTSWDKLMLFP